MKQYRKAWTRAELEERLGPPAWEANDETRSESRESEYVITGRAVQKHAVPPPPISGVDRWMAWDCAKLEPLDPPTVDKLERLVRGNPDHLARDEAQALIDMTRDYLERSGDHCSAATRVKFGDSPDKWFMLMVCSRHTDLSD